MDDPLVGAVLLVLAGIGVIGVLVLLLRRWRLVLKLLLAGAVLVAAAVVLCRPLGLPFCSDGTPPDGTPPHGPPPGASGPPVSVRDAGTVLEITSHRNEPLRLRAAYVVPIGGGNVGVCNPYGPPGNRTMPMQKAEMSYYDQPLPPFQTWRVPSGACPNHVGYSVWVYNRQDDLVWEEHR